MGIDKSFCWPDTVFGTRLRKLFVQSFVSNIESNATHTCRNGSIESTGLRWRIRSGCDSSARSPPACRRPSPAAPGRHWRGTRTSGSQLALQTAVDALILARLFRHWRGTRTSGLVTNVLVHARLLSQQYTHNRPSISAANSH